MADHDPMTGYNQTKGEVEVANDGLDSTSTEVEMDEEVVRFSASHESVKLSLMPPRRPNEDPLREAMIGRKKKSRVLKEVTDNLFAMPVQMKPNAAGPTIVCGPENKARSLTGTTPSPP